MTGASRTPSRRAGPCCRSPASGRSTGSRATSHAAALRARAGAARVCRLSPLGVRERRARPRAASGGPVPRGRGRTDARPVEVRRVRRARRASDDRAYARLPRSLPGPALQARRATELDGRDRHGARIELGCVDSIDLKGQYSRHGRRQPARPGALPAGDRGIPRCMDRGPRAHARDEGAPRAARRPRHLGRDDPLVADIEALPWPP